MMASGYANTSDSLDVTVKAVPEHLLEYAVSNFVQTLKEAKNAKKLSAEVHIAEGQLPKFVLLLENQLVTSMCASVTLNDPLLELLLRTVVSPRNDESKRTKTILVKNVPKNADEELLELLFESSKKQGGGPVQSVEIIRDKNVAFVEFCDRSSVEKVINKRPIKLGTTVLGIEPYEPLLQGSEKINRMDVIGLPASFTEGLLKEQLDSIVMPKQKDPNVSGPRVQPSPIAVEDDRYVLYDENWKLIRVGSRVVRGRDWQDGYRDGGGEGTVTDIAKHPYTYEVYVKWPNGRKGQYLAGPYGFQVKLAHHS